MATTLVIESLPVPLSVDESGWIRVAGTRIPLETVIRAHRLGKSPEQIADAFSSLRLADVYLILGYAHRYPEAIDSYLDDVEREEIRVHQEISRRPDHIAGTRRIKQRVGARTGVMGDSARNG